MKYRFTLSFILAYFFCIAVFAQSTGYTVKGKITDDKGKAIDLAAVILNDALGTNSGKNGNFELKNVPAGVYNWHVQFVGYQTASGTLKVNANSTLNVQMKEMGLKLQGVTVTASQAQMGSKSQIGQEAIRHLQPKTVGDLLQLVPGNLTENPNLNKLSQAHIREIEEDDNNAMGTSVVVDGTPLSNDANLQSLSPTKYGSASSANMDGMSDQTTAGKGVDLRTVSAGNVESVEVIRGIPSVEYGNLTSGVVIVKTKSGRTPWEAKVQVDPFSKLVYAGKGFNLKQGGAVNFSLDWSQSWSDTRKHYLGYDRITATAGYSNQWGPLSFNARGSFFSTINNRKTDPQMSELQLTFKNKNTGARFSVNGSLKSDAYFFNKVDYNVSLQMENTTDTHHDYIVNPDGVITDTRENGIHTAIFKNSTYYSDYKLEGKPLDFFSQIVANKYIQLGERNNTNFKLGGEYTLSENNGEGLTFDLVNPPQSQGAHTLRPRAYKDIPALNTVSGFVGNKTNLYVGSHKAMFEAGLRLSNLFLNKEKSGGNSNMLVLEPRLNASMNILNKTNNNVFDDLSLTGGFGLSNKMPTLLYLYPDNVYYDNVSLSKWGDTENDRLALLTTDVITKTQNSNLKPTNTRKWEVGLNFRVGKVKGFVTYFNEHHKHEFGFDTQLFWSNYYRYTVPATANNPVFDETTGDVTYTANGLSTTATKTLHSDIQTWGMPSNNSRSFKHGIEYGLDFGEFKPLRTSLSINGAWFHINRVSETNGVNYINKTYDYVAVVPAGSGSVRDRINTTFRFITHIPVIRMIFTTTVQCVWYESAQAVYQDNSGNDRYHAWTYQDKEYLAVTPLGFYDRQGNYNEWNDSYTNDATYNSMVQRYQTYAFKKDVINPWVLLNFRFTKELGNVGEISFIANNFPNTSKWHTNKWSLSKTQLYPDMYFGAELKLKL